MTPFDWPLVPELLDALRKLNDEAAEDWKPGTQLFGLSRQPDLRTKDAVLAIFLLSIAGPWITDLEALWERHAENVFPALGNGASIVWRTGCAVCKSGRPCPELQAHLPLLAAVWDALQQIGAVG